MKFEELGKETKFEREQELSVYWKEIDILNKQIDKGKENFVFYDGPATANGMPGVHHVLSKLLKDTFCKYKSMQGYKVIRKVGWDCHGLPVEISVEEQLGLNGKEQIEEYGIEAFNVKCKESVLKNESAFRDLTEQMGQFINLDDPYLPMSNNYIESVWYLLDKMFKEGYIYEGNKIVPYCPRCGTALATHEVAQGYKEIKANTVTVPFKVKGKDEYFLVWTTTPWTLIANVGLCVNPDEEYVRVKSKGYTFILAKKLLDAVLGEGYEILEIVTGEDLEFIEYEQLMPFINVTKKAFFVTCDDYVTMEDGTGVVHIAPAYGEDDSKVGRRYDLPTLNPVSPAGLYTEGPWKDKFVLDNETDIEIITWLKTNDKLFKKQAMNHNYPHCWRCKTPLLNYGTPAWYIETTKVKDKMIENNNGINWYPSFVGEKRFGNWLEELRDWGLSRNRYWGTPLPIWKCSCGHIESIGSVKELVQKSIENIDETIELHRPYVDDIHLKCSKCDGVMNRESSVIDVWFDSGAMPFAQYHYPFENKDLFDEQFPADFIAEGVDQTRGWFYVLLAISTIITGESSYKNVLVNDHVVDKHGKKMGKSVGNMLDPFELFEKYGADPVRWYLFYVSPVWTPLKFDENGIKEVISKFFRPLYNTYTFFSLYANTDGIDPKEFYVEYDKREEIDKWIISKYNKLVKETNDSFEEYDGTKAVRLITDFVSEDLSNWYIRRNRRRFWASKLDDNKKAVYNTTYEILLGLTKLIAPIASFTAEELYLKLTDETSVHLDEYPVHDDNLINEDVETKMDLVRNLVSLGRMIREKTNLKVRQPLSEIVIDGKNEKILLDLVPLIKEELNVKAVLFEPDLTKYMNYELVPNFRNAGPILGNKINMFRGYLENITEKQMRELDKNKFMDVELDNELFTIAEDMVEFRINAKEGFDAAHQNNDFVILNTTLDPDLISEGIAREIISKVQNLRKDADFDVMDRIIINYNGDNEIISAIKKHLKFIKTETLADSVNIKESLSKYNINGHDVELEVEKVS